MNSSVLILFLTGKVFTGIFAQCSHILPTSLCSPPPLRCLSKIVSEESSLPEKSVCSAIFWLHRTICVLCYIISIFNMKHTVSIFFIAQLLNNGFKNWSVVQSFPIGDKWIQFHDWPIINEKYWHLYLNTSISWLRLFIHSLWVMLMIGLHIRKCWKLAVFFLPANQHIHHVYISPQLSKYSRSSFGLIKTKITTTSSGILQQ